MDDITVEIQGLEEQKLSLENEKRVKVPHLKELRNQKDGELNIFTTALPSVEEHSKEVNCPLCKMGTIDYPTIKKHLDELRDDKKNLNNQIKEINMHYNEVSNNISRLSQRKTDIEDKIDEYESRKQQATNQLTDLQGTIKQQLDEIKRFDEKIEGILKSLDEINAQVTGDDEKLIKEYDKKQLDLRDNQLKINEIKKEREKSSINIKGVDFKPKEAKKKYEQIIKFIEKAVEFTSKRSEYKKQKAKVNFNQNIQNLIKKLGFQEFRSIKLNDKYQLYVVRFHERSGEYVLQQVKTLSTSEKSAIALILQIALKQMYIPDLDFLILDDVLGNFDEDKKIKILDYLSNKANEEDWYIILTTLTDEDRPLEIKAW